MKPNIHPDYQKTTISCACGAVYDVGSTKKNVRVDICAKCHPFFTGVQKIIDTGGRVERFRQRYGYLEGENKPKEGKSAEDTSGKR